MVTNTIGNFTNTIMGFAGDAALVMFAAARMKKIKAYIKEMKDMCY